MKAIYLKEFRENFKWAALAMLALGAFLGWAINGSSAPELLDVVFFFATISGFSTLAIGLGLIQVFQDQRRGREAFIVHRPIQRSTVFAAKALAGLTLYFIAAGVPLLIAILWCYAHRYRTAPFEWSMAWPAIWDLVNGTTVYFAGLFIATRDAKWFGSRLMPLVIPLFATIAGYLFARNISEAMIITFIGLLLIIPAAWSSFVHDGHFEPQRLVFRTIQTAIITAGLTICFMTVSYFTLSSLGLIAGEGRMSWWDYVIDDDGHLLRREINEGAIVRTTDLAGNVVATPPQRAVGSLFRPAVTDASVRAGNVSNYSFHRRESYLRGISFDGADMKNEELTYSVRRRVIEEFDGAAKRWIGTIGQDGFVPAPQVARPFERPFTHGSVDGYVHDGKNAFHIGVDGSQLRRFATTEDDDRIHSIARFDKRTNERPSFPYLAVLTAKRLQVYQGDRLIFSIPQPFAQLGDAHLWITAISNGHFAILYQPDHAKEAGALAHLIELDDRGQQVKQTDAPARPVYDFHWWSEVMPILPAPMGLIAVGSLKADTLPPAFAIVEMGCIALLCGLVAAWQTRKYAFTRAAQTTWIILCALMGIPGLLALLSVRSWPARVKCPACGQPRLVTRQTCEYCGAAHAIPSMEGIEIFEEATPANEFPSGFDHEQQALDEPNYK